LANFQEFVHCPQLDFFFNIKIMIKLLPGCWVLFCLWEAFVLHERAWMNNLRFGKKPNSDWLYVAGSTFGMFVNILMVLCCFLFFMTSSDILAAFIAFLYSVSRLSFIPMCNHEILAILTSIPFIASQLTQNDYHACSRSICDVFYLWVLLHKFNRGFLFTPQSCAVEYSVKIFRFYRIPGASFLEKHWQLFSFVALFGEAFVLLLLQIPSITPLYLIVVSGFHLYLAIHPRLDFGVFQLICMTNFLHFTSSSTRDFLERNFHFLPSLFFILWIVLCAFRYNTMVIKDDDLEQFAEGICKRPSEILSICLVGALAAANIYAALEITDLTNASPGFIIDFWSLPIFFKPLIILTFILGCAPYIGWNSQMNFAMFSNLRVDSLHNNHLFLPSKNFFGGYLIEILESSHPDLDNMKATFYFCFQELQRYCWLLQSWRKQVRIESHGFSVQYKYVGRDGIYHVQFPSTFSSIKTNDPALRESLSFWQKRIRYFKPVPKESSHNYYHW